MTKELIIYDIDIVQSNLDYYAGILDQLKTSVSDCEKRIMKQGDKLDELKKKAEELDI